jgi:hypothetical protein
MTLVSRVTVADSPSQLSRLNIPQMQESLPSQAFHSVILRYSTVNTLLEGIPINTTKWPGPALYSLSPR